MSPLEQKQAQQFINQPSKDFARDARWRQKGDYDGV